AGRERTPFVVLSADATADTLRAADQAGARAFLTKPVVVARLLDALADIALGVSTPVPIPLARSDKEDSSEVISRQVIEELAELQLGEDFLLLFIDECMRDAVKCIGELEKTALVEQWDAFRDQCHALKGVASNMGAIRLAAVASDAMRMGNWELSREWRPKIRGMREQLEAARVALRQPSLKNRSEMEPDRR
ncbi:MAG: Hpt domain-containing protein, partial [Dokdonella sp.]